MVKYVIHSIAVILEYLTKFTLIRKVVSFYNILFIILSETFLEIEVSLLQDLSF